MDNRCKDCVHFHYDGNKYGYCDRPEKLEKNQSDRLKMRRPHRIASERCFEAK